MEGAGDRLEMPDGTVWTVLESPQDRASEPFAMEMRIPHGGVAPPPHTHPGGQRETYEVSEGSFEVVIDGRWRHVETGETAEVESGQVHTFRNRSGELCVLRNVHNPGRSFERYVRRLHEFVSARDLKRMSPTGMLGVAQLWQQHSDTLVAEPRALRLMMGGLAGVGRIVRVRIPE